jgi:hypothetical protein
LDFFAFYEIRDEGGDTPTSTGGILAIFEVPFISTYEKFLIGFKVSFLEAKLLVGYCIFLVEYR